MKRSSNIPESAFPNWSPRRDLIGIGATMVMFALAAAPALEPLRSAAADVVTAIPSAFVSES